MITHIALALVLSILAQFGVQNPSVTQYNAKQNEGFCVEFDAYHNEICVETRGIVGVYLCNVTLSDDCGIIDVTPLSQPSSTLEKVLKAFDCSIDMEHNEPYCYVAGEVEHLEDGDYIHKSSQFVKAYNLRVFSLPTLKK